MPDYQVSKIYKLWSPSTNLIYIGSTTQTIAQRLAEHVKSYRRFKNGKGNNITSFKILECEDYKIELIELYPCNNREQLFKKEGEYIKNIDCINKCIMGKTDEDYKEERKIDYETNKEIVLQNMKNYYQTNKEIIKQKTRQYRKKNKEKIEEYFKQYREKNKEKIKKEKKEYAEKNKERIKEKRKQYYEKNKEKMKEYIKQYREKKKLEKLK